MSLTGIKCIFVSPEGCLQVSGEVGGEVGQAARHEELPDVAQVARDLKSVAAVAKVEVDTILNDNKGLLQALQHVPLDLKIRSRPGAPHPQPAASQGRDDSGQRVLQVSNLG